MKTGLQQTSAFHSNLSLFKAPHSGLNGFVQSKESNAEQSNMNGNCPRECSSKHPFKYRLKNDRSFRKKIIQTAVVGWAFFFLGWSVGIFGPCFPDLMLLLDRDLEAASWLFTIGAFGYLVGSMLGGIVYDKYNKLLLLFASVVGMSVTNGAIPWCPTLPLMLALTFLCSMFEGCIETGGNADIVSLWGAECSPFMLAIHFAFSAGGIISPFVAQPFLAEKVYTTSTNMTVPASHANISNNGSINIFSGNKSDHNFQHHDDSAIFNETSYNLTNTSQMQLYSLRETSTVGCLFLNIENERFPDQRMSFENDVMTYNTNYGKTNIQYSFLIAAVLSLSSAIPFLALYWTSGTKTTGDNSEKKDIAEADFVVCKRPSRLPFKLKLSCLSILSVIMFMYNAVEDNFTGLLMTFSLSHLSWSKSRGTVATSLDWASFAFGRFIGIFLVRCIQTSTILTGHLVILVLSFIAFLIASVTSQTFLIWVFIPLVGFSKSVILPSVFSWTEETILPVTGKISSLYLVAGAAGSMVTPLLFGYLMEEKGSIWYIYLLLGMSVISFVAFILIRIIERVWIKPLVKTQVQDITETVHLNGVV